jgi:NADPH-dependent glutamate synthase beta subunit-like oxidoreductase
MYAADRLLTHYGASARVDILDKSPVPFGLVRSGVAPDHASTKSVVNRFEGVLSDPRVCFFGNAALGRDVSVDDLTPRYHAVVLAYGATGDRTLDVPGEDTLRGAISARRFVGWFNGDPEAHGDDVETSKSGGAKNVSLHDEITACLTRHVSDVSDDADVSHDDTRKRRSDGCDFRIGQRRAGLRARFITRRKRFARDGHMRRRVRNARTLCGKKSRAHR